MRDAITSADIKAALAVRYQPPEWCLFFEVSNDTGTNSRRYADAVAMSIWPSRGYAIHGHEIKVSRSDFIAEMRDPAKADAVGEFCDFWWLVTPPKLVAAEELPTTWGLMEMTGAGMRVKKQAPKRESSPPTRGFLASMIRRGQDMEQAHIRRAIEKGEAERQARVNREVERRTKELREQVEKQAKWQDEFDAAFGVYPPPYTSPAEMAARIKLAQQIGGSWGALAQARNSALRLAEAIAAADPSAIQQAAE